MSAQVKYATEMPTAEDLFGPEPEVDDLFAADDLTVTARRKASAFAASFNALMHAAGIDDACKDAGVDPNEARRVYMVLLEMAMRAEIQAETQGRPHSKRRRYHCAAWLAELIYRREVLPRELPKEEKERRQASLSRQWRRRWREVIHPIQCRTHWPLVEREQGGAWSGKREASRYIDHLGELLTEIATRGEQFKKGLVITRYNRAAAEVLARFREEVSPYAPEWVPEVEVEAAAEKSKRSEAREESPTEKAERIVKRAGQSIRELARGLPPEEAAALRLAAHEWLEEVLGAGPTDPADQCSPVLQMADRTDLVRTCTSYLNGQETAKTPAKTQNPLGAEGASAPPDYSVEYDAETEPRGQSLSEAEAALDAFVSVGAQDVVVVVVDDTLPFNENKVSDDHLSVEQFRRALPYYLEHNQDNDTHSLCVRPRGPRRLIQVDDCTIEELRVLLPDAFFVAMTSPNRFQVWIALSDAIGSDEEFKALKRRFFKKLNPTGNKEKANGGANGSIRWPGTLNCKPERRYPDGGRPRVQLLRVSPGRVVSVAALDAAGLLAPPPRRATPEEVRELKAKLPDGSWPDIFDYLSRRGDRSGPECSWAMAALGKGWPRYLVVAKLKEIGPKARIRDDDYAEQTVAAAWSFLTERAAESGVTP